VNGAKGRRPAVPARLPSACVVCATRAPRNGAVDRPLSSLARCRRSGERRRGFVRWGRVRSSPVMNGSFRICRLSTRAAGHDEGGPGRGTAAGAIGTSRDRAGKDGGKPSLLRLSIVHFSFDAAVRGDGAPHSCPPLQGKGLRASRRGLRSGEGFHLRLHRASHPPICRAIDIWPDDWAASLWAPP
jgi:hypothetical protein